MVRPLVEFIMNTQSTTVYRASILNFQSDPYPIVDGEAVLDNSAYQFYQDGALVIEDGKVQHVGEAHDVLATLPSDVEIVEYKDHLIIPGMIDTHIHYPQVEVIAS